MREKVKSWINEQEENLLKDLNRLVKYRSVSVAGDDPDAPYGAECRKVLDEFLAMGEGYGFTAMNAGNRVGSLAWDNGAPAGASIGLWGHLDVVPDNGEWVYPPYAVTRKGDYIIGRGVADNKGPAIASLYAMRCIRDLKLSFSSSVTVFGGCAEETSMDDVEHYTANYKAPDYNIVADGEFPVGHAEKGILDVDIASPELSPDILGFEAGTVRNIVPDRAEAALALTPELESALSLLPDDIEVVKEDGKVRLTARGLAKHSARPEGSLNAIGKLAAAMIDAELLSQPDKNAFRFIRRICGEYDGAPLGIKCRDEHSGELTCVGSVVKLEGTQAVLNINIRYPVTIRADDLAESIGRASEAERFKIISHTDSAPNFVEKDSFFVKALTEAYNEVTGECKEPYCMAGGTYARKLPNAVVFGCGLPYDHTGLGVPEGHGLYHCPDESYSVELLKKGLEIYIMSLIELDKAVNA